MTRRLHMLLLVLFIAASASAEESCQVLNERINKENALLVEFNQQLQGISDEFDKRVSEDLWAQVEGAIDKNLRDTAIKTAFVKKRLTKTIDDKTALLGTLKRDFCSKCAKSPKNEAARMAFCEKCPQNPVCTP